jgi:hypothetical protein
VITIDEQAYPIVVMRSEGDVQNFTKTLETIFNRATSCGVIMISTEHSVTSPDARRAQAVWMKQQKPRIAETCRGFAWVLHSPVQLLLYKPMLALQGRRMMGCPTAAFGDLDSAKIWLHRQLA